MNKDIYSTLARLIEIIDEQVRPAIKELPEDDFPKGSGAKKALSNFALRDSILPPFPEGAPFVAIDPVAATPTTHAGGTMPPELFHFDIYIAAPLSSRGAHTTARRIVQLLAHHILCLPRLYANKLQYGEDYIRSTPYSICQISCTFPL